MVSRKRIHVVSAKVSPTEKRLLQAIAEAEGTTLSATVRRLIMTSAAQRVAGPELVRDILPRALADMGLSFDDLMAANRQGAA